MLRILRRSGSEGSSSSVRDTRLTNWGKLVPSAESVRRRVGQADLDDEVRSRGPLVPAH